MIRAIFRFGGTRRVPPAGIATPRGGCALIRAKVERPQESLLFTFRINGELQASLTDGKAQRNMEKLELFRSFLTMFGKRRAVART